MSGSHVPAFSGPECRLETYPNISLGSSRRARLDPDLCRATGNTDSDCRGISVHTEQLIPQLWLYTAGAFWDFLIIWSSHLRAVCSSICRVENYPVDTPSMWQPLSLELTSVRVFVISKPTFQVFETGACASIIT